jgi:fumarate hydratase subunit beta
MEHRLKTPISAEDIASLHAGDVILLSGTIFTARDKAHALLRSKGSPVDLKGAAIYHCGPLMQEGKIISAGPTTSGRMARYTDFIIDLGVRAIIGKGGLPAEPFLGIAVYLAYPGGCGAAAAKQLRILNLHMKELGMAEAMWVFEAHAFGPMVVAIDSYGRDLYKEARGSEQSRR